MSPLRLTNSPDWSLDSCPRQQFTGRLKPGRAGRFMPSFVEYKGRDSLNALGVGNAGQQFRIYFRKDGTAACCRSCFGKFGSHHRTGTAPRCPEIDDHRQSGLGNQIRKIHLRGDLHWKCRERQLSFAGAAMPLLTEAFEGNAIG